MESTVFAAMCRVCGLKGSSSKEKNTTLEAETPVEHRQKDHIHDNNQCMDAFNCLMFLSSRCDLCCAAESF